MSCFRLAWDMILVDEIGYESTSSVNFPEPQLPLSREMALYLRSGESPLRRGQNSNFLTRRATCNYSHHFSEIMSRVSAVVVVALILKCISKPFFSGKANVGFADLTVYLDVCKASHSCPRSSPVKLPLTTGEVTSKEFEQMWPNGCSCISRSHYCTHTKDRIATAPNTPISLPSNRQSAIVSPTPPHGLVTKLL